MTPNSPSPAGPGLQTAMRTPLADWENKFIQQHVEVESWFRQQWRLTPPPFYSSVDLRNAGFKLAPVDTNLFPAGFNNLHLNPAFIPLCIQATQTTISQQFPSTTRILIIPENHTRNLYYWDNIYILQTILREAGFETRIGSLIPLESPRKTAYGELIVDTVERTHHQLRLHDFTPSLILLNNDLAEGIPDILQDLEQPIIPPTNMGWSSRLKSTHFKYYQQLAQTFSSLVDIDPWRITPYFENCGAVDFQAETGLTCVAQQIEKLLTQIEKKYREYHISQQPFVIVKADAGTYGMGIMTAFSPDDVLHMNRKTRNKMTSAKSQRPVHQVIVQEGVYTSETHGPKLAVAEPVVYMMGAYVVGGFYRIHTQRRADENLNAPGMQFEPLAFASPCQQLDRFYIYGVIARLAALAAAHEYIS